MKSGLYDREGASATARQAACANWFEGPTMKVSNVYRGISPLTVAATSTSVTSTATGAAVFLITGAGAIGAGTSATGARVSSSATYTMTTSGRRTSTRASEMTIE